MPAVPFGQLLINNALPPQYRDYQRVLDGKGMESLLSQIATDDPDLYADVAKKISDVGREVDFQEGDTLSLDDNLSPIERKSLFKHVRQQMASINKSSMSDKEKESAVEGVFSEVQKAIMDETVAAGKKNGNRYARQITAKARGNPLQMTAITSTPSFYRDASGKVIPVFIEKSYSEGLRPHEYWAATYGARAGVTSTKFATREGGDIAKQLTVAGGGLVVTEDNCGTLNGVPASVDDDDNMGAVLARAYGPYKAGTPITKEVSAYLRKQKGLDEIIIKSPMTCQARTGVCKHCAGLRETGKFPDFGYNLGIVAGSALAEQIAQGALSSKHTSGQKIKGKAEFTGFPVVEQFMQVPKSFPNRASVAELDGRVEKISPAPQGGWFIDINGQQHYSEREPTVKPGSVVEAGDALSSGLVNPAEVVKYKGIGEGRRYFANNITQIMKDSGWNVNRRNSEAVSRSLVDNVNVQDFDQVGDYLPGDRVSYNSLLYSYRPRKGTKPLSIAAARGKYLEQPMLHYSIGTRVSDSVVSTLKKHGIGQVMAHDDPPAFEPEMMRLRAIPYSGQDWLAKLWSSNLKENLLKDTAAGAATNLQGTHPIPRIVEGLRLDEGLFTPPKVTR